MNPNLTQKQVCDIMERNAQKVGRYDYRTAADRPNGTWNREMGYGLVDASACVVAAQTGTTGSLLAEPPREVAAGGPSETYTAPEGYLESLPQGPELAPAEPDDSAALAAGFGWYNNVGVNLNTRLLGTSGTTQISVYARDIRWRYAFGSSPDVTSPGGNGGSGGSGWRFPNAHRFGITIYQGNRYWNVTATSPDRPTVIAGISNTEEVRVTVNDTNDNYSDNSGAFDLYLRKDN